MTDAGDVGLTIAAATRSASETIVIIGLSARHREQRRYFNRTLSLPLFAAMTADDVIRVVGEMHRVLGDPS